MADADHDWNTMPWWCWAAPLAAGLLVAAKFASLVSPTSAPVIGLAVLLLGGAVFAAVHHAEVLAVRIGEPFGSILLALAITTLEVGLIISVMASGSNGSDAVARDTVYSVVMIVLNGIVGLCLVFGSARHFEQEFRVQGAAAILSVIATLAVVSLVLPNFTRTTAGPTFAPSQLVFVGAVSLGLYALFVFVQTVRHRADFVIEYAGAGEGEKPTTRTTILSAILLVLSLGIVILLAKTLSPIVEAGVVRAGLPLAVVGVVIATLVLLPEGLTAMKAARRNRLQTSLNASLGSAAASIGLTIPIVGAASIYLDKPLTLGLGPEAMVLLILTLFVSTLTFATGRTTVLQGAVHLVIFGVFLFLAAVP
ncbi:MAG: calcium:proton antiporter [Bosea sp. (in: a-proteobacteria)]|jgi:Ca2+:H+ antiporter